MRKIYKFLFIILIAISLSSCRNSQKASKIASDTLYVERVEGLSDDFILGMDASSSISILNGGASYYDFDGRKASPFKTLHDAGINYIRARLWNDPYDSFGRTYGGGANDLSTAIKIGAEATKYGMPLLLDFHYSDFWADPGSQSLPKAWRGMNISMLEEALYNYTRESLLELKRNGIDVGMVQIGNETSGWICEQKTYPSMCRLFNAGSRAVREVYSDAKVVLHFTGFEYHDAFYTYPYELKRNNVDYDIFGVSYYPFWNGSLEELNEALEYVYNNYNKPTMVLETSYPYMEGDTDFHPNTVSSYGEDTPYPLTVQGQANHIRNTVNRLLHTKGCLGLFYWEGTWINAGGNSREENEALWNKYGSGWATSYAGEYSEGARLYYGGSSFDNQALFDRHGHPLESLKVYSLMKNGNNVIEAIDYIPVPYIVASYAEAINLDISLEAFLNNNQRITIKPTFRAYFHNNQVYKLNSNTFKPAEAGYYRLIGEYDGNECIIEVEVKDKNYLLNGSFEDEIIDNAPKNWYINDIGKADLIDVERNKNNSCDGVSNFHYWSKRASELYLYQRSNELLAGSYKFSIKAMGGDMGVYEAYAYVKINDKIIAKESLELTKYGYWDIAILDNIRIAKGDLVECGIYIKASGANNGSWAMVDDARLIKLN